MGTDTRELTPRERDYLNHLAAARTSGQALSEYCREQGLSADSLYRTSHRLAAKGYVEHRGGRSVVKPAVGSDPFVAVRVAGSRDGGTVCKVRHPSGWLIECTDWPEAVWMSELMGGGPHAGT